MEKHIKPISMHKAFAMAVELHKRGDGNILQTFRTALELRWEANFLAEHGITIEQFQELIGGNGEYLDKLLSN